MEFKYLLLIILLTGCIDELKFDSQTRQAISECKGNSDCILNLAIQKDNLNICQELKLLDQSSCEMQIAENYYNRTQDISVCAKFFRGRDYCYKHFNEIENSAANCEKIIDEKWPKSECYAHMAAITNNTEYCKNLKFVPGKDFCFNEMGKASLDETKCYEISSNATQDECFVSVGQAALDIRTCNKVVNFEKRESCRFNVAIWQKDPALCDYLEEIPAKEKCRTIAIPKA